MAHQKYHLPLLPSGPDGVHSPRLHGTQLSTPLSRNNTARPRTSSKSSAPL